MALPINLADQNAMASQMGPNTTQAVSDWTPWDTVATIGTGGLYAAGKGIGTKIAQDATGMTPGQAIAAVNSLSNQVQSQNDQNYSANGIGAAGQVLTADAGIAGFFGGSHQYPIYTANGASQTAMQGDRAAINGLSSGVANMPTRQMTAAQAAGTQAAGTSAQGATIDQQQQAQFRQQQMGLAQMLQAQANGTGPSVAGSQLQQSTEQNLQAALAQAASTRGGNLGAAQYQLANARANITQQAGMQLAQQRMQEQMNAQGMLGNVLEQGRGADIGLASQQAQLGQQNNQFNANLGQQNNQFNANLGQQNNQYNATNQQNAGAANLQAGIAQDQFRQQQLAQLLGMGYSMDQAMAQMTQQSNQYNAGLIAQQYGAANGLSLQAAGQGMQMGGAMLGAMGQVGAGAAINGVGAAGGGAAAAAAPSILQTGGAVAASNGAALAGAGEGPGALLAAGMA